ncbi:MAG: hypothetical protein AB7K36_01150 [Chloroflexota bacterium]
MDNLGLTEEEQINAGRTMVAAALNALGKLPDHTHEEDQDETARRVVRAFYAVETARNAMEKRMTKAKGERIGILTDTHQAVSTAFWLWSQGVEIDLNEVSPRSAEGSCLIGFARGIAAVRAMTEAMNMLDGEVFFSENRGTKHLSRISQDFSNDSTV